MSELKEKIQLWLEEFRGRYNSISDSKISSIKLFSGIKPMDDWSMNYTKGNRDDIKFISGELLGWFVEVWVDDRCVLREIYASNMKDFDGSEERLLERLLNNIILMGISKAIDLLNEPRP